MSRRYFDSKDEAFCHKILTCERDVKAPVGVGVVGQELQASHVSACRYRRGQDVTGKRPQDGRLSLTKNGGRPSLRGARV